jgi:DegV family protein with EDD domain
MSEYVLSCCSPCDLSNEWIERRQLSYIPFTVSLDGKEYLDDMGNTFSPRELYKRMAEGADAKTSQVSTGDYIDYFRKFLKEGKDVVHISLSTGISGTFQSAHIAAKQVMEEFPGRKVYAIDSLAASSGYGLLVDLAADKRDEGLSAEELAFMKLMFQRRHLLEHNNGMVDQRYLDKSGDTSYSLGQRIIVKEADAHSLLAILRKLGNSITTLQIGRDSDGN